MRDNTIAEAARILGVCRDTVYKYKEDGSLDERLSQRKKDELTEKVKADIKLEYDEAMIKINKEFGEGTVVLGSEVPELEKVQTLKEFDEFIGGGVPRGRVIEFFGTQGVGKTTLALQIIPFFQKLGKVAYIDVEYTLKQDFAEAMGVDWARLRHSQPGFLEQIMAVAEGFVESGEYSMVVFDSVAQMIPKPELECQPGETIWGRRAALLHQFMRRIVPKASRNKCTLLFINHEAVRMEKYAKTDSVGGSSLKFASSLRLRLRESKEKIHMVIEKTKLEPMGNDREIVKEFTAKGFNFNL